LGCGNWRYVLTEDGFKAAEQDHLPVMVGTSSRPKLGGYTPPILSMHRWVHNGRPPDDDGVSVDDSSDDLIRR
jgi:hypothetical protein